MDNEPLGWTLAAIYAMGILAGLLALYEIWLWAHCERTTKKKQASRKSSKLREKTDE